MTFLQERKLNDDLKFIHNTLDEFSKIKDKDILESKYHDLIDSIFDFYVMNVERLQSGKHT